MEHNEYLRNIVLKAHEEDVSDIYIQTENPVFFRAGGMMYRTGIIPTRTEIDEILGTMFKDPGIIAAMYDKEERDLSYALSEGAMTHRFRVNVCLTKQGIGIVMRRLKTIDPNPDRLGVPQELTDMVSNTKNGIVFIAGVTGSGKSTTLASMRLLGPAACVCSTTPATTMTERSKWPTTAPGCGPATPKCNRCSDGRWTSTRRPTARCRKAAMPSATGAMVSATPGCTSCSPSAATSR